MRPSHFIRDVVTLRESLLTNARTHAVIKDLDARYGHQSILNSVTKMASIKRVAQSGPMIEWVMEGLK